MEHAVQLVQREGPQSERMGWAMSRAFFNEPNFTYIIPDDELRMDALAWFFGSFVLRLGLRYGEVYIPQDASGGAVWARPHSKVAFGGAIRAGLLSMPFQFGWGGFRRSITLSSQIERTRARGA